MGLNTEKIQICVNSDFLANLGTQWKAQQPSRAPVTNQLVTSSTFHVSHPTQRSPQLQLNYHVTHGIACNASRRSHSSLLTVVRGAVIAFSRLGRCKSEIEKPKSVSEGCLGFPYSLVDLILNAQANEVAIEPRTKLTKPIGTDDLKRAYQIGAVVGDTSSFVSLCAKLSEVESRLSTDISASSSNIFVEPGQMENNDRTLKELATPDVLEPAQTYELKFGLIHLLPKFHGLAGEDPHKHLKEFHVVCSIMRP
ncbi:hypothetical protein CR513_05250, partial [Mucuna pruriens]